MPRGKRTDFMSANEVREELGYPPVPTVITTEFIVAVGRGVQCVLEASGLVGTVTWSLPGHPNTGDAVEADLPPGMHLGTHGLIGHPTTPGVYRVPVMATDQTHPIRQTAVAVVTVTVEDPNPDPT